MNESQGIGLFCWVCVALIAALISVGIIDGQGREERQHVGELPAGVEQLSPTAYLIEQGGPQPLDICQGKTADGDRIRSTKTLTRINRSPMFIECARSQEWGIDEPLSEGFDDAMVTVGTSLIAWAVAGGTLFLFMLPGTMEAINTGRRRRAIQRKKRLSFEQKRQALTDSWARKEISDLDFENRLQELMDEAGIKELREIKF
jgi:hypothetical protein